MIGVLVGVGGGASPYLHFVLCRTRGVVRGSNDPGVITTLLQFHHDINEPSNTALHSFTQCSVVLGQYPSAATAAAEDITHTWDTIITCSTAFD